MKVDKTAGIWLAGLIALVIGFTFVPRQFLYFPSDDSIYSFMIAVAITLPLTTFWAMRKYKYRPLQAMYAFLDILFFSGIILISARFYMTGLLVMIFSTLGIAIIGLGKKQAVFAQGVFGRYGRFGVFGKGVGGETAAWITRRRLVSWHGLIYVAIVYAIFS